MFRKYLFFLFISFLSSIHAYGDQKEDIIKKIIDLETLEFTFKQKINDEVEEGSCLLKFPGKLKCNYFDNKQKELLINNRKLAITQKRYDKTYFFPVSKSPLLNILYKKKLIDIIKTGDLKKSNQYLQLIYNMESKIIILFDRNNFELSGWEIIDQYNNKTDFKLKIIARNSIFPNNTFKLPLIN
mgnify:CR=1 FL=1